MSYLRHIKTIKSHSDNRWVVKFDSNNKVREVKLIFNPKEYKQLKNSRKLLKREELIEILEKNKQS